MEAAKKKHEAIETDTAAYKERVQAIEAVAKELEAEGYHDIQRINKRKDNILRLWEQLQELLAARRQRLEMNLTLQQLFQEMLHCIDWMDEVKVRHQGLGATVGWVSPWVPLEVGCHHGLGATVDWVPLWVGCHDGLGATMD